MPPGGGEAENTLAHFTAAGVDLDAVAKQLQIEGAQSFVKSWTELMQSLHDKSKELAES
jgi:transaldolase